MNIGDLAKAHEDVLRAVAMDCNQCRGYERLAQVYAEMGDSCVDEGTAACAIAMKLGSSDSWLRSKFVSAQNATVVESNASLIRALDTCHVGGVVLLKGAIRWCISDSYVFRKPIRLAGWSHERVTITVGNNVTFNCHGGYVENIRFECIGGQFRVEKPAYLRMRSCAVSSRVQDNPRMAAVSVQRSRAQLIDCIVEGCTDGDGILAHEAVIEMTDCEITGCAMTGLELVGRGTNATLTRCKFSRNRIGVAVVEGAVGRLNDCVIEGNFHEGLLIQSEGGATVCGGHVRHNGKFGITVQKQKSKLDIKKCNVQDNAFWGLNIDSGACARVENCVILYSHFKMGITLKRVEGLTHFEMIENKPQAHVVTLVRNFSCQGPDEITIV